MRDSLYDGVSGTANTPVLLLAARRRAPFPAFEGRWPVQVPETESDDEHPVTVPLLRVRHATRCRSTGCLVTGTGMSLQQRRRSTAGAVRQVPPKHCCAGEMQPALATAAQVNIERRRNFDADVCCSQGAGRSRLDDAQKKFMDLDSNLL